MEYIYIYIYIYIYYPIKEFSVTQGVPGENKNNVTDICTMINSRKRNKNSERKKNISQCTT